MTTANTTEKTVVVRWRGMQDYHAAWQEMQQFTKNRDDKTPDEIWLLEHASVFTQGQNGKAEHILDPGRIPIVQTDRGGQVTYHGPGQLMVYTLIDLKRKQLNVREVVAKLLQAIIDFLNEQGIAANSQCKAPGVYVAEKKIASIGLRIRRGCSYHGLAFNVAMDLAPFNQIHPCGFSELKMTQLTELVSVGFNTQKTAEHLIPYLMKNLGYTTHLCHPELDCHPEHSEGSPTNKEIPHYVRDDKVRSG